MIRTLWQDHVDDSCRLWPLSMGSDQTRVIVWEAFDKITGAIHLDSVNLTMSSDKTSTTACRALGNITATTLTTNCEFRQDGAIEQVASTKQSIVQIWHTWLHHVVHKHSRYHPKSAYLVLQSIGVWYKYYFQLTVCYALVIRITYNSSVPNSIIRCYGSYGTLPEVIKLMINYTWGYVLFPT